MVDYHCPETSGNGGKNGSQRGLSCESMESMGRSHMPSPPFHVVYDAIGVESLGPGSKGNRSLVKSALSLYLI